MTGSTSSVTSRTSTLRSRKSTHSSDQVDPTAFTPTLASDDEVNMYFADSPQPQKVEKDLEKEGDDTDGETLLHQLPHRSIPFLEKVYKTLYPGYILDHLDYKSFRVAFRTWVTVFTGGIMMAGTKLQQWLGPASFMILIMNFILPSGGMAYTTMLIVLLLMMFYSCFAWMTMVVAMAVQWAIRGWPSQKDITKDLITKGFCSKDLPVTELANCVRKKIYTGYYLTTDTTVVMVIGLMFCLVITRWTSGINPLFKMGYIILSIFACVIFVYSVYLPFYAPKTVAMTLLKPYGLSLCIQTVCAFVIFPQSMSFQFLEITNKMLDGLILVSENNIRLIKSLKPSANNFVNYAHFSTEMTKLRGLISQGEAKTKFIKLETSYCRFDLGDIGDIRSAVKNLHALMQGFNFYYGLLEERKELIKNAPKLIRDRTALVDHKVYHSVSHDEDRVKHAGSFEVNRRRHLLHKQLKNRDPKDKVSLEDLDKISAYIAAHFMGPTEMAHEGLQVASKWLADANQFRIYPILGGWSKAKQHQQENATALTNVITKFEEELKKLDSSYMLMEKLVEALDMKNEARLTLVTQLSLFLQMLKNHCYLILRVLKCLQAVDSKRTLPGIINFFTKRLADMPSHVVDPSQAEETEIDYRSHIKPRNPDKYPPANKAQWVGNYLVQFYLNVLINSLLWSYIFGAGLVIAAASPYLFRTLSEWIFNNHMIWLPIMVAVSLTETTGETVYMFGTKVVYSVIGAVTGMVAWYICQGNSIGFAAVLGVIYVVFSYFRHFAKHEMLVPQILMPITAGLVLGTSWSDDHGAVMANIGSGWRPCIVRLISVVVGLCFGLIPLLVPHPKLAKVILRRILGKTINDFGTIHCLISKFAFSRESNPETHIAQRHDFITEQVRKVSMRLQTIGSYTVSLQHELPIGGYWPQAKYERLTKLVTTTTQVYYILYTLFDELEDPAKNTPVIMKRVGWNLANFLGDLFLVIQMSSNSLTHAMPLPRITQAQLSIKHMELLMDQWGVRGMSYAERWYDGDTSGSSEAKEMDDLLDEQKIKLNKIDYHRYFSQDGQVLINILLFAHILYGSLDELMILMKSLVGEHYDYDEDILDI